MYPIFASYKAYVEYSLANKNYHSGTLNIGGVNVPISTLLKRATGDTSDLPGEAVILVYQSNKLNKWLVFWIVNSSFELCSSVLLLRYIVPFFSLIKFAVSLWFLVPLIKPVLLDNYNSDKDLSAFFSSGCGFCFKYAISHSERNLDTLNNFTIETLKIKDYINQILDLILLKTPFGSFISFTNLNAPNTNDKGEPLAQNTSGYDYIGSIKAFGTSKYQNMFSSSSPDVVEEEYDVIENPTATSSGVGVAKESSNKRKSWGW